MYSSRLVLRSAASAFCLKPHHTLRQSSRPANIVLQRLSRSDSSSTAGNTVQTDLSVDSNSADISQYDIVIVGCGIIGLATARELKIRNPKLTVAAVDKEDHVSAHQSGNNSGVIHAGIYYTPGSLKAKLCVKGLKMMYAYCEENNIPYNKCGKLIVAVDENEASRLNDLYQRGIQNNVPDLGLIDGKDIPSIEPNCKGLKALHSPHTGIVDYKVVTESYAKTFEQLGGKVYLNYPVTGFGVAAEGTPHYTGGVFPISVISEKKILQCKFVLTCAGLYSDKVAQLSGCESTPKIVPFRGDYLLLKPEKRDLIKGNIYPVPNPKFPFLGVHFTPRIDGNVWLGPNAVLAMKREGYGRFDIQFSEAFDALKYRGLQKLVFNNFFFSLKEFYRGLSIGATVKQLQRFVPSLTVNDVMRGPSGVRAQALGVDGSLVDDFVFDDGTGSLASHMLHVRNAPSPACTSSLAIAELIADKAEEKFSLKQISNQK